MNAAKSEAAVRSEERSQIGGIGLAVNYRVIRYLPQYPSGWAHSPDMTGFSSTENEK
jgi:hypothetical protein